MKNILNEITSKIFRWKIVNSFSFDDRAFQKKSVMVVNKNGKLGIVLRFGYQGNLQYHELFEDDLPKFRSAFEKAVQLVDKGTDEAGDV